MAHWLHRWQRLFLVLGVGILPAFIMRCDRAALNFQRGFFQGLGEDAAQIVGDMLTTTQP